MNAGTNHMIDMVAEAYIMVYGREKWDGLSDQQKHDAVMYIVRDMLARMD